jgi:hypothetical protein
VLRIQKSSTKAWVQLLVLQGHVDDVIGTSRKKNVAQRIKFSLCLTMSPTLYNLNKAMDGKTKSPRPHMGESGLACILEQSRTLDWW